ncbi:riboflavin synthase [Catalinimonas alkaloidigena]|uniref:Riboflavin synthase n=1 Tax=Catalinimonas alkaloidigena TaxID=1075417 RepID=A0A1G9J583_9BACT|nr:riboflavin synthase [Catalinimonas alkaloidigena]SDL32649.1 riboflavin synthase [Catalinimonas alkaloidigena]
MFTGIVETLARLTQLRDEGTNRIFTFETELATEFKIDQSISHNGVCLTVTQIADRQYEVLAVEETLQKSNLGKLCPGDAVNLERCMPAHGRFDGHIVQGHVDQTGTCTRVESRDGSWLYDFAYDASTGNLTVEKGSIAINGVSLTVFHSEADAFRVTIIPYTYQHTTFQFLQEGDTVNLEFDILGKYIQKIMAARR